MKRLWHWWCKRRERTWTNRYLEAIGRMDDLRRGEESLAMKLADIERWKCESLIVHYREMQGLSSPRVEPIKHSRAAAERSEKEAG